jgi:ethanolamine utilization microcompartment shell protein EutL
MTALRSFFVIDRLQPQVAGFLGTVCTGEPPLASDAALLVEVSPAMDVNRVLDAALKATRVVPGMMAVEREFGIVELHARSQADVREAARRVLDAMGLAESDRAVPRVVTRERITGVDPHHAQMLNRTRHGNMQIPADTLWVLETEPAGYALLAANEAEKAARIEVLEFLAIGAFGRVYLGGDDEAIRIAADAAASALEALSHATLTGR